MAENDNLAMDWDDEVEDSGGFTLLDAGYYPFTVLKLERERFEGSEKCPACPRAHLTLKVESPDEANIVHERMMLTTRSQWRISRFFEAMGFEKNPETGKMAMHWNEVEGRMGWLKLGTRSYTDRSGRDREVNEVDEFVKPADLEKAMEWYNERFAKPAEQPAAQPAKSWNM